MSEEQHSRFLCVDEESQKPITQRQATFPLQWQASGESSNQKAEQPEPELTHHIRNNSYDDSCAGMGVGCF